MLFIQSVNRKHQLNSRLAGSPQIRDWVEIARDVGFDFTTDDFMAVLEETIQRKTKEDEAVREFLLARKAMGAEKLSRRVLYLFIGGVARSCDFQFSLEGSHHKPSSATDPGIAPTDHERT